MIQIVICPTCEVLQYLFVLSTRARVLTKPYLKYRCSRRLDENVTDRVRNDPQDAPQNAPPPRWKNIGGGRFNYSRDQRQGFKRAVEMVLNGNTTEGGQHRRRLFSCQPFTSTRAEGGGINHANLTGQRGDRLNNQVNHSNPSGKHGGNLSKQVGGPDVVGQGQLLNHSNPSEKREGNLSKQVGEPDFVGQGQLQHPSTLSELPSPSMSASPPLLVPLQPPSRAGEPLPQCQSSVFPERDSTHDWGRVRNGREEDDLLEIADVLTRAAELVR